MFYFYHERKQASLCAVISSGKKNFCELITSTKMIEEKQVWIGMDVHLSYVIF